MLKEIEETRSKIMSNTENFPRPQRVLPRSSALLHFSGIIKSCSEDLTAEYADKNARSVRRDARRRIFCGPQRVLPRRFLCGFVF